MSNLDVPAERVLFHYPHCFGCGSANNSGLHLTPRWNGQQAVLEYQSPPETEGGPGVVHGGFIGALIDEVAALVSAEKAGGPVLTKRAEINFRSPMPVGAPIRIVSEVSEESERNLTVKTIVSQSGSGKVYTEALAVFVKVIPAVWIRAIGSVRGALVAGDWNGGDPSNFLRWQMKGGLAHVFRPALLDAELRIRVEITDADPPVWLVVAGPNGFAACDNACDDWDACFRGPFRQWLRVIRGSSPVTELDAADEVVVDGDLSAFAALTAALDFGRFT